MSSLRLLYFLPFCLMLAIPVAALDEKDVRLDQKISMSAGSITMEQFAAEFTKLTGVQVTTGSSKSDWRTKERRTIIYVKDVSAGDLMQRVARLHHFRLSKSGSEGKWVYNYRQDRRAREEESKLRDEKANSQYAEAMQALDYMAQLSGVQVSQADKDQLAEKQPYMCFLINDPLGRAMCDVAANLPADIFSKNGKRIISLDQADPALKEAATRFVKEMRSLEVKWHKATGGYPADAGDIDYSQVSAREIRFEGFESGVINPKDRAGGFLGELDISYGDNDTVDYPFLEPDSVLAKIVYKAADAARKGKNLQLMEQEVNDAIKQQSENYPLKGDPILDKKIKLEEVSDYSQILKQVHEKTGLSVISDTYREKCVMAGEQTIKQIVELARNSSNKEMTKRGKWLTSEDSLWFLKRLADIPEAYLQDLREKLKERDLVYHDFAKIAGELSDTQIDDNLSTQHGLEQLNSLCVKETREGLRFLNSLTPQQLESMAGESSLPANDLSPQILEHALSMISRTTESIEGKDIAFTGYKPLIVKSNKQQFGAEFAIQITEPDGSSSTKRFNLMTFAHKVNVEYSK